MYLSTPAEKYSQAQQVNNSGGGKFRRPRLIDCNHLRIGELRAQRWCPFAINQQRGFT